MDGVTEADKDACREILEKVYAGKLSLEELKIDDAREVVAALERIAFYYGRVEAFQVTTNDFMNRGLDADADLELVRPIMEASRAGATLWSKIFGGAG